MLKRVSVESILVMFLFILFTASIGVLIVEGQEAFTSIVDSKTSNEDLRIGLSYINMKVKQNNLSGHIHVVSSPFNDRKGLEIRHFGEEEGYLTYIYSLDDGLYEFYIEDGETINKELGELIVNIDKAISFDLDKAHSLVNVFYDNKNLLSVEVFGLEAENE